MDGSAFDAFARSLATGRTRRSAVKMLGLAALAAAGFRAAPRALAQAACTPSKEACQTNDECCRGACVDNVCDSTCSEAGAICETNLDCCSGNACLDDAGAPRCLPQACGAGGAACIDAAECCSGICRDALCLTVEPTPGGDATPVANPTDVPAGGSVENPPAGATLPKTGVSHNQERTSELRIIGGLSAACFALAAGLRRRLSHLSSNLDSR